ncbi:MAG: nitroreductase [Deltaproteobacteria bacterium]|nr:nitroreductase [Deltaproteobacteria bacterium]
MDILEAINKRKSIRHFLHKPVTKEVMTRLLTAAVRAPSANNTQPWEFVAVAGKALDRIREKNTALLRAMTMPNPDHSLVSWAKDSVYRKRQVDLAKELFRLMGIAREDKEARGEWLERGFRYFEAPAALFVLADRSLSESGPLMDIGAAVENFCIAALTEGLGTCIEDQGVMYPDVLREELSIPPEKRIVIAVAVGFPDPDFPANALISEREPVENVTRFVDFF